MPRYRLTIASPLTGVFARSGSSTATPAAVTACTLPTTGITGAYLVFENP